MNNAYIRVSSDKSSGNKLSWYCDASNGDQINYSNVTYGYIGIG